MLMILLLLTTQAVTNCTTNAGVTRCVTTPSTSGPIDYGSKQPTLEVPTFQQPQPLTPEQQALLSSHKVRKKVGKLIADGKCDKAIAYALEKGQFGIASEAKKLCAQ